MGRQRDRGDERWATVTETAEALAAVTTGGYTPQAIYNRIKTNTIPHEQIIDETTSRPRYLIPRDWLEQEVENRARAASIADVRSTVEELNAQGIERILAAVRAIFSESDQRVVEGLAAEIRKNREAIEGQRQEVTRRLDYVTEMFEDARDTERAYQQNNLELQRENRELQRQTLELLSRVEAAERERAEQGQAERRGFFRRLFSRD